MRSGDNGGASEEVELVLDKTSRDAAGEDNVQGGDWQLQASGGDEDVGLLGRGNATMILPVLDSGSTLPKLPGHRPDAGEQIEQVPVAAHEPSAY